MYQAIPGIDLNFGIELEFYFIADELKKHIDAKYPTRAEHPGITRDAELLIAREFVSAKLNELKVENKVYEGREAKSSDDYKSLAIKSESLHPPRPLEQFEMELATRIYNIHDDQRQWMKDMRKIFAALTNGDGTMNVESKASCCSTQIHISPANEDGRWTLAQLKAIAKAALYYERCLDMLISTKRKAKNFSNHASVHYQTEMPDSRSDDERKAEAEAYKVAALRPLWKMYFQGADVAPPVQSSHSGVKLQPCKGAQNAMAAIDSVQSPEDLAALMCTTPWYKPGGQRLDRHFNWNFLPVVSADPRGTVEFRMQEGSTTATDAIARTLLPLAFVQAALSPETSVYPDKLPLMCDCERFVKDGLILCGYDFFDADPVFQGKRDSVPSSIFFQPRDSFVMRFDGSGNELSDESSSDEDSESLSDG